MCAAGHLISIEIEFLFKSCPALRDWNHFPCQAASMTPIKIRVMPLFLRTCPTPRTFRQRQSRIVKIRFYEEGCICPTCEHSRNVFYVRASRKCAECFFRPFVFYENLMDSQRCTPFSSPTDILHVHIMSLLRKNFFLFILHFFVSPYLSEASSSCSRCLLINFLLGIHKRRSS